MYFYKLPEEILMRWTRVKGILLQEIYVTRTSLEVFMDIAFFPIMTTIVIGFFSDYLNSKLNNLTAYYLLLGSLLWEIVHITQYSMSVSTLWNVWSKNLSNVFITPISLKEFLLAHMISSVLKTTAVFIVMSTLALILFKFNVYSVGFLNLITFWFNLTFFAWSTGIIILGMIFLFGTRIQAFAWG